MVSQRLEAGQGILGTKAGSGKHEMLYDVVCQRPHISSSHFMEKNANASGGGDTDVLGLWGFKKFPSKKKNLY